MTFIYKIISIDVDGDKITDGDLFLKFKQIKKNGEISLKLIDAKFVDNKSIKKLVKKIAKNAKEETERGGGGGFLKAAKKAAGTKAAKKADATKAAKKASKADATNTPEPIQIQDKTTFGQYMKQYLVAGFALNAGKALFEGIAALFSSEES